MNYLDNGGNLYIESVNIGSNYYTSPFFDYFGITYVSDGGEDEVNALNGGQDLFSEGLQLGYFGGRGYGVHFSIDRLEANGSQLLFSSEDGYGRMFLNQQDNYIVITSSILLGAIGSGDLLNLKPYLVSEIVNYFLVNNPVTSIKETDLNGFNIKNYPNPFTSETTIEYSLAEPGYVSIEIYNSAGQLVKNLFEGEMNSGNYSIIWNGTDAKGCKVKSGLYFYKINIGNFVKTEKIMLCR